MSVLYPDLSNTNFPDNIDTIVSLLNVTAADAPMLKEFQTQIQNGNFTAAQQALSQIQNSNRKIISSSYWNTLRDAVLALERFYKTDIEPYVEQKQEEWELILEKFSFIGLYNSVTQYVKNNYVTYTVGGIEYVYIAIANPPVGALPTNTTYWRQLTIRGARGQTGEGASFSYGWDSLNTYSANDIVSYDNKWWVATTENTGQTPQAGSPYWSVVIEIRSAAYPVQEDEPVGQAVGMFWFQVIS